MAIEGPLLYVQNAAGKIMALDKTTGASAWSTTNTGYSPPQIANNLLYTTDAAHNYNALDPATGVRNLFWTANVGLASRPYIDGPNMYVFGIDSAGNNFVTSFNAVTTGVNWRRNAADLYENPVVTGNTIYAIENNYASGASRIVMFDSNSGTYQDAITITPWEFGEIRIITVAGKFIHPY